MSGHLVGRETDIHQLVTMLTEHRIVTLTGPPGVGKTAVALAAADRLRLPGVDVHIVDLGGVTASTQLVDSVLTQCGGRQVPGRESLDVLAVRLRGRTSVIVLDECEYLAADVGNLVTRLTALEPSLRILATSRRSLGVANEQVLVLPPLALPSREDSLPAVVGAEAVALLLERARAAGHAPVIGPHQKDALVTISRELDGLPLAIELAAAQLRSLSVNQLAELISSRFELLEMAGPCTNSRRRSLNASISASYDLANASDQRLLAALSIFSGHFSLDAAAAIARVTFGEHPDPRVLSSRALTALVDQNLVVREQCGDVQGTIKFRLLTSVREFLQPRRHQLFSDFALIDSIAAWVAELAATANAEWFGEHQTAWQRRLLVESETIDLLLQHCADDPSRAPRALAAACDLWFYWVSCRSTREGRAWIRRCILTHIASKQLLVTAAWTDCWLAIIEDDRDGALAGATRLTALLGSDVGRPAQINGHQMILAAQMYAHGPDRDAVDALEALAVEHCELNAPSRAADDWFFAAAGNMVLNRFDQAERCCQAMMTLSDMHQEAWSKSYALWLGAVTAWRREDYKTARTRAMEGFDLALALEEHAAMAVCLDVLAWLTARAGAHDRSAVLLGACDAIRDVTGLPLLYWDLDDHDRCSQRVADRLGKNDYDHFVSTGRSATIGPLSQLRALVDATTDTLTSPSPALPGLTGRQWEIAALIADGLANKEIAERLFISVRTVDKHVENIFAKLGIRARSQIGTWVGERRNSVIQIDP